MNEALDQLLDPPVRTVSHEAHDTSGQLRDQR